MYQRANDLLTAIREGLSERKGEANRNYLRRLERREPKIKGTVIQFRLRPEYLQLTTMEKREVIRPTVNDVRCSVPEQRPKNRPANIT